MTTMQVKALAPAKVNLTLRVLGRRPDNYHDLDSLMARLELADELTLEFDSTTNQSGDEVLGDFDDQLIANSTVEELPPDFTSQTNLILRAVKAFRAQNNWPNTAVSVNLKKNIPLAAGLGGGSSDGAAVLRALNNASPKPLSKEELAALGLSLGADVPFFLQKEALARAQGLGEILTPAKSQYHQWQGRALTLVNPGVHLSTALVFEKLDLTNASQNNTLANESELGSNDLWLAAIALAPVLKDMGKVLEGLEAEAWGLSGSGPTFWLYKPKAYKLAELTERHSKWWVKETFISSQPLFRVNLCL